MKSNIVGAIFARGGSKGVPRKNIRELAGKPLIAYAIEAAKQSRLITRVIVSTDDSEIADVARGLGAEAPFMRPRELAEDQAPEWLAWQHAIQELGLDNIDVFVCVPPTSPLRSPRDIDACIEKLLEGEADVVIAVKEASRNPYFNMVVLDDKGFARLVIEPDKAVHQRQAAPAVYDITTMVYAARPEFVAGANSMFEGKVQAVVVPDSRAIDIDTEMDFKIAEFLLSANFSKGQS